MLYRIIAYTVRVPCAIAPGITKRRCREDNSLVQPALCYQRYTKCILYVYLIYYVLYIMSHVILIIQLSVECTIATSGNYAHVRLLELRP